LEKVRSGSPLDEAEQAFAESAVSDQAKKYLRLRRVEQRAHTLFEEAQPVHPIEAGATSDSPTAAETSDDWINKFREDASLVDDDLVREIYARVLSEEAKYPAAFSLRTLGVLRYLDREAATAFGTLQKVVIDDRCIPRQVPDEGNVLTAVGLDHTTILMLGDAGLVNAGTASDITRAKATHATFHCSGHGRLLLVQRPDKKEFRATIKVHLLTPAGEQLARIAEAQPDEDAFIALTDWFLSQLGKDKEIYVAELPARNWSGPIADLAWRRLNSTDGPRSDE